MADAETLLRALRLRPDDAELACDLADVLASEGKLTKAILLYRHALDNAPGLARACYGAGCAENLRQDFTVAAEWFGQAVTLAPNWLEARHNLARALYELGRVSEAFAHFQHCASNAQSRAMLAVIVPGVPEADGVQILSTRQSWLAEDGGPAEHRMPHSRLRVAYVSSFFQRDNWMKPVWGLLNQHDRSKIEIHLFSDCPADAIRYGYQWHPADQFLDTSKLSNDDVVGQFDQRGIDVVVDLNGYSNMRRLPMFSRRLSPIVIGWFNHYATTGLAGFDYLIGDDTVVESEEEKYYSEKILRVSGSYLAFDVRYPVPEVERCGGDTGFVFGALASQYKITTQVLDAWSEILLRAPASSLLIKNQRMEAQNCRDWLTNEFKSRGVASERLRLEGPEAHFEFLKAYNRIDLTLDTFPYNGGTTTTESLWQGVPVLCFRGDRWVARTSASIVKAAALEQFIADNVDAYIGLAVKLASAGLTLRQNMRGRLRAAAVCDTQTFARQMEEIFSNVLK